MTRVTSPARAAHLTRNRTLTYATLAVAGLVGLACFLGSTWAGRLGIAVLAVGAVAAARLAWLEVDRVKTESHEAWLAMHERLHEESTAERKGVEAVLRMMRDRNVTLARELLTARDEVVASRQEAAQHRRTIAGLNADQAVLTAERDVLRKRLAEIQADTTDVADEVTAEILTLPRRVVRRSGSEQTAAWQTGEMPSVTALVTEDAAVVRRTATPLYQRKQA